MIKTIQGLDWNYIQGLEAYMLPDISAKDFTTLKYKEEHRYIFKSRLFPNFNLSKTIETFQSEEYNTLVKALKYESLAGFEKLFKHTPKGVGPGELLLYFLIDDVVLGGGSSAGLDITTGNKGFEVKAASLTQDGWFCDFKIGGTINISAEISAAAEIKKMLNLPGRETEIGKAQIELIKLSKYADDWKNKVEIPYKVRVAEEYFGNHETIFLINEAPKAFRGECFVKKVQPKEVHIASVTAGTIKPNIRR